MPEVIEKILGLSGKSPEPAEQRQEVSRLARASCVLGLIAPFSLALIFILPCRSSSHESILLLPFFVSGAAFVLSLVAMLRIAFASRRKKGIILVLIGLILGGGTLAVVVFIFLAAEAIRNCPFFG